MGVLQTLAQRYFESTDLELARKGQIYSVSCSPVCRIYVVVVFVGAWNKVFQALFALGMAIDETVTQIGLQLYVGIAVS